MQTVVHHTLAAPEFMSRQLECCDSDRERRSPRLSASLLITSEIAIAGLIEPFRYDRLAGEP